MEIKKWWLIADDDVKIIREALGAPTHTINDYNCEDWPIGAGCAGCKGDEERERAIYVLDTGLHQTDAIPADYQGEV
jgi:hypothetical protein